MTDPIILVTSAVLTLVLPVSVGVLYAILTHRVQLAASSAADSAVVERFDSEAERAAFHADMTARAEARTAAALASYYRILQAELARRDPGLARQWHQTQAAQTDGAEAGPDDDAAVTTVTPIEAACAPTSRRVGLWRARLPAVRGNGSAT